jgi:hypothetical protein
VRRSLWGGRTWIPAFAGITVERVCGGGRNGERTGVPGAMGRSCQARALRFSPRFHHHRAVMSGAGLAVFAPPAPPSAGHVRRHLCTAPPCPHHRHPRERQLSALTPDGWAGPMGSLLQS